MVVTLIFAATQMKCAIQPSLKIPLLTPALAYIHRSKALFKSANKNKGPWAGIIKNSQQKPCCRSYWSFEGFPSLFLQLGCVYACVGTRKICDFLTGKWQRDFSFVCEHMRGSAEAES